MFAVIRTGGKQYTVEKGTVLKIEKLEIEEGKSVIFDDVLLVQDGESIMVGTPIVKGAAVKAKVLEQGRSRKEIIFTYKSKTRQSVKNGHRQHYTKVEITGISIK